MLPDQAGRPSAAAAAAAAGHWCRIGSGKDRCTASERSQRSECKGDWSVVYWATKQLTYLNVRAPPADAKTGETDSHGMWRLYGRIT